METLLSTQEGSVWLGAKKRLVGRCRKGASYPDLGFRGAAAATGPASVPLGPSLPPPSHRRSATKPGRDPKRGTARTRTPYGTRHPGPDPESREEGGSRTNRLGVPRAAWARGAGLDSSCQPPVSGLFPSHLRPGLGDPRPRGEGGRPCWAHAPLPVAAPSPLSRTRFSKPPYLQTISLY